MHSVIIELCHKFPKIIYYVRLIYTFIIINRTADAVYTNNNNIINKARGKWRA